MSDWGLGALCFIVFLNTVFIAGIALFLWQLNRKLDELSEKADPMIARATETLGRVEAITADLQKRTAQVLEQTSTLVDSVAKKVDTTTSIAEETISQPLIGAASLVAGISRGVQTYRQQTEEKGDSQ